VTDVYSGAVVNGFIRGLRTCTTLPPVSWKSGGKLPCWATVAGSGAWVSAALGWVCPVLYAFQTSPIEAWSAALILYLLVTLSVSKYRLSPKAFHLLICDVEPERGVFIVHVFG